MCDSEVILWREIRCQSRDLNLFSVWVYFVFGMLWWSCLIPFMVSSYDFDQLTLKQTWLSQITSSNFFISKQVDWHCTRLSWLRATSCKSNFREWNPSSRNLHYDQTTPQISWLWDNIRSHWDVSEISENGLHRFVSYTFSGLRRLSPHLRRRQVFSWL